MRNLICAAVLAGCGRAPATSTCTSTLAYKGRTGVPGGLDRVLYVGSIVQCPVSEWSGDLVLRLQITSAPSPGYIESLSAGATRNLDLSVGLARGSTAIDRNLSGSWRLPWSDANSTPLEVAARLPNGDDAVPTEMVVTLGMEDDVP